jgi:hypothetical protein
LSSIKEVKSIRYVLKRQGWHALSVPVLAAIAWAFAAPSLGAGEWLGVLASQWFWVSIAAAVLHQTVVALVFRMELGWGFITSRFPRNAMKLWGFIFFPLFMLRPLLIIAVAMSTRATLMLPEMLARLIGAAALIPALYTFWSVYRYFGVNRALGGDHFYEVYRRMPLVREGAFRWTGNAMYTFGFLPLWTIALFLGSQAALSAALFQHAYIWVHYHCTERPDMDLIYGGAEAE